MADHPVPWLDEILRTAGDISPATASEIQHAAEYAHQARAEGRGEARGEYAARQAAKGVLAGVATESDPVVQAALRASKGAREHADRLFADAAGPDGTSDLDTPEGLAFYLADHAADELYEEYSAVYGTASERYRAEVNQAWRKADMDFLRSHRAELEEAADPEGLTEILEGFTEDSSPSAGRVPARQPTGSSETGARHARDAANSSDEAEGAGDPRTPPPLDFPAPVVPGIRALLPAPPRATGQAHRPPTRRAL
jgi:hypothetical protein